MEALEENYKEVLNYNINYVSGMSAQPNQCSMWSKLKC